ncbi:hypothetical protein [Burkholderia vietnamiensis]|uniref:hypothetical protein n=1 Tax=Burkholderia vietnamiensis TaxID=60552 RepID=UPI001588483F|nr:hypothetical protein [Burkholderia vietnamiensis]
MTTQKYFITDTHKSSAGGNATWFYLSTGKSEDLSFYKSVDAWVNKNTKFGACMYKKSEHHVYMPGDREWVRNDFDKGSLPVTYEIAVLIADDAEAAAFEEAFSYKEGAQ